MEQHRLDAFQVIADPSRRQILYLLSKDSLTINSLAENFEMSRQAVSKHIKVLSDSGFISIQDNGRERHCSLHQDGFIELQTWLDYFDEFWDKKLKNLGNLLTDKKTNTKPKNNNK